MDVWLDPMCRPCRGFLVVLGTCSHRCRGGLRCDVPSGLPEMQEATLSRPFETPRNTQLIHCD